MFQSLTFRAELAGFVSGRVVIRVFFEKNVCVCVSTLGFRIHGSWYIYMNS